MGAEESWAGRVRGRGKLYWIKLCRKGCWRGETTKLEAQDGKADRRTTGGGGGSGVRQEEEQQRDGHWCREARLC